MSSTNLSTYFPGTSLQVPSPQFSRMYDYARDMIDHGKRLIMTESSKVTEKNNEFRKDHQQEDEDTDGSTYKSTVPSYNKSKEVIRFYLYPLEDFPSFWGPNSTCDYSKILNPKHDAYIYAIQAWLPDGYSQTYRS